MPESHQIHTAGRIERILKQSSRTFDEPDRRGDRNRPTQFGKPRDFPKGPRFTRYTLLIAERSKAMEETLNADHLRAPSRTPTL